MLSTFRSILGFRETTVNQYFNIIVRNATKKSGGSSKNGRDSKGKRLGVKKHHKESVIPGNIIIRQRGKTFDIGEGVGLGKDYTIYSLIEGVVNFKFNKNRKKQVVSVFPHGTILPVKPVPQKRPINRGYGVFNIKPHGTVLPGKPFPEKQPINRGDGALNVKQAQQ